ncbi:cardiolipin synthase [Exiguobacterium artemiae]|uniref:cardiolipin synthase n=1 Tax=Exiguobacterium artemiae TaxID=340145 RepID=UPI0029646C5C|nr:cardiolipin synthase [Exiguobacterium sibiricum]MDW2883993.1 cardiolipin synthase [Exiguobacterium sibiricum]
MLRRVQLLMTLLLTVSLIGFLSYYWSVYMVGWLSIVIILVVLSVFVIILLENRNPERTLVWALVMMALPVVGVFVYFTFGQNYRRKKMFRLKAMLDEESYIKYRTQFDHGIHNQVFQHGHYTKVVKLIDSISRLPISYNSHTKVLTNGQEKFPLLLAEIRQAEHHIHLEYYIVRDDELALELQEALIERAKAGVEIRFLYDAVGCFSTDKAYFKKMELAGIEVRPFFPVVLPFISSKSNYRNHRKIVVIDGTVAFTGGINVGDEYMGKDKMFGFWRDTHLLVRGEAVSELQLIFLQDWYYMTGERLFTPYYMKPLEVMEESTGGVQIIASGPDEPHETMKSLYFGLITEARSSVYIASPYLIPDEDLMTALKTAAMSGIDVRILLPSFPDHKVVFYASRSYFDDLLLAGVKIYEYNKGFMHSKVIVVDDAIATIGTANMDLRSFHLNFEVNAFLYGTNSVHELTRDFYEDFSNSSQVEHQVFIQRSFGQRLIESISRLFSPLL